MRLLISCWASTNPVMFAFLKSLASMYNPKSGLDIQVVSSSSRVSSHEEPVVCPVPQRKEFVIYVI